MAWKQDLAKLKQQLEPEPVNAAPKPLPKTVPKPSGPVRLDDEDAVFLSAMGLKRSSARADLPVDQPIPAVSMAPTESEIPESFMEAVKELKGLKPMTKGLPQRSATPTKPDVIPSSIPVVVPTPVLLTPEVAAPPVAPDPVASPPHQPLRFQLAAGMALDVDGSLDLRGHSLADALERLKDRLADGQILGWRSLQVTLGPDPTLHEGLLALLASGQVPMVARYAQAPVPMGGTQAWLLYFSPSANQS